MYVYISICMHAGMHAGMHACMHACMHVCMYVCMYACIYVYSFILVSVSVPPYVCIHLYIYIHKHTLVSFYLRVHMHIYVALLRYPKLIRYELLHSCLYRCISIHASTFTLEIYNCVLKLAFSPNNTQALGKGSPSCSRLQAPLNRVAAKRPVTNRQGRGLVGSFNRELCVNL